MNNQNSFWLDKTLDQIEEQFPDGEILVSSGASPSGIYHIGHLREVMTGDAVAWGLRQRGRDSRHIHFVDDFDALRKIPANIDLSYEQYLGVPLYLAPDPFGNDFKSYADRFLSDLLGSCEKLGLEMEVIRSHELYLNGDFTDYIEKALTGKDKIREAIEQVSGRQLKLDWSPVQILDDDNKLTNWQYKSIDTDNKTVKYVDSEGVEGEVAYTTGRVKLDWRIDWPARWHMLGVNVEPFGRDHATKGGSYDTGLEVVSQVFDGKAPFPVPYEFINIKGQTKKMSASKGTGILPKDALNIMPPEILTYFVLGARPGLTLQFDVGKNFGNIFNNFGQARQASIDGDQGVEAAAYRVGMRDSGHDVLLPFPFTTIVNSFQSAVGDKEKAIDILARTEGQGFVEENRALIERYIDYADNWLANWAPDEAKFVVQDKMPEVELSDAQQNMLKKFSEVISEGSDNMDGQWYHEQIHGLREEFNLQPKEAFQAIYRSILGKDFGPKAGWFLSILDRDFLIKRFSLDS